MDRSSAAVAEAGDAASVSPERAPPLRMVSVCRALPTPEDPSSGIFVLNRLAALGKAADVKVIQQLPHFPLLRPLPAWGRRASRTQGDTEIAHAPMFYVPGILKSLDAYWLRRAVGPAIERLHARRPLDLIDAHFGYPEGAACAHIGRELGVPVFVTLRGFEAEFVSRDLVGPQLVSGLGAATGCIAVSHSLRDLAIRHGVRPERVRVIHNAVDAASFNWGDPSRARAQLQGPLGRPLIVSVGHLIARKRHHLLLEAFARVRKAFPGAVLAIIGGRLFEPHYPDRLARTARELGVGESVRFLGNLPPRQVALWLQAADTFALATAREGCCNAVLEALATGAPVVTTDAGDNAHFVRDGENGCVVAVDDVDALGQAMERTLSKPDWDRSRISRTLLHEVGSWDDVAVRVLEFMHERLQAEGRTVSGEAGGRGSVEQTSR